MPSRRRALLAGAGLLAGVAGCTTDAPSGSDDTGPTDTPTPSGPVAWTRDLDGAVEHEPAVSGDTVVVGTDAGAYGLAAEDGSERWSVESGRGVAERPVVAGGVAYLVFGSNELGGSHRVEAVDASGGSDRWTFAPEDGWLEVLAVHDGTVYVGTSDDAIGDDGEALYAIDAANGEERWTAEIGDPRNGVAVGDTVAVGCHQRVYGFDAHGRERWRTDGPEYQYRTLGGAGETVWFVGSGEEPLDTTLYALDAATGSERWTFGEWTLTSTRFHDGTLYAGGKHVQGFDLRIGEAAWEEPGTGEAVYDAPVVDGRLLAWGVSAYDLSDGTVDWTFSPDVYIPRPTAVVDDTALVHASHSRDDRNRLVFGVGVSNGDERFRYEGDAALTDPVGGPEHAFAGSESGTVYAFRA